MKKGYTLAEILLTLTIVGIVAALTIPPVVLQFQKKLYTTTLQKEYSKLSESLLKVMTDERVANFYESKAGLAQNESCTSKETCESGAGYFLLNYVDKDTKNDCTDNGCFGNSYRTLSDSELTFSPATQDFCIRTTRGSSICATKKDSKLRFTIDVNGVSGPNVGGRDLFALEVQQDGSVWNSCEATTCGNSSKTDVYEHLCGCLTNIINANWKMEY